ncbi:glycoside hydrolase family 73 protein [Burkholderia pseudomallei]|uniref:glycoside hydrolase family 73 protein n=1 Tax=Burkholderia pseudomallei TaxID=28450 RepID=UPI002180D34A|nr:glycoside hydrolase family 73 protein [Burkholderia pseudomallei]
MWRNNPEARERYAQEFGAPDSLLLQGEQSPNASAVPDDFISEIGPPAQESAKGTAIPASFTVADAALESGWGTSQLAQQARNLFGIKANDWNGPTVSMPTREYINNQWVTEIAQWRSYPDWLSSIQDHAVFLQSEPRYASAFQYADGPEFAAAIAACGYATDPNYANEVISIIATHDLTRLDV